MRWAFKILNISGISIKIHATFILFILLIAITGFMMRGIMGLARPVFYLLLFMTVLLHELGHSIVAKLFGIKVRDITLLPIGGVARLERMPEKPFQEILLAISGPLVSLSIAFVTYSMTSFLKHIYEFSDLLTALMSLLVAIGRINFILAIFNLIPAFPMDGGRILRALFSLKLGYVPATSIAATIGQGLAILFGLVGLFTNPWLLFIAFFIYIGAEEEAHIVKLKSIIRDIPVRDIVIRINDYLFVKPEATMDELLDRMYHSPVAFLLVGVPWDLEGVITKDEILESLRKKTPDLTAKDIMRKDFILAPLSTSLTEILEKIPEYSSEIIVVVDNDEVIGILTPENILKFFVFESTKKRIESKGLIERVFRKAT